MRQKKSLSQTIRNNGVIIVGFLLVIIATLGLLYVTEVRPNNLTFWEALQNLASPTSRIVKIIPGMRKEQVANRLGATLGWTSQQKQYFIDNNREGYMLPDTYIIPVSATPNDVSAILRDNFNKKITSLVQPGKSHASVINLDTAVKIASIIEREAGKQSDLKIISAVIWNRTFQGIPLDMDDTLQYAKATPINWWPVVVPADKNIDSPYNTYANKGFPPTPISNPSEAAIWAAFNPAPTKVVYYIHDKDGNIHTALTYKQHLANINRYY